MKSKYNLLGVQVTSFCDPIDLFKVSSPVSPFADCLGEFMNTQDYQDTKCGILSKLSTTYQGEQLRYAATATQKVIRKQEMPAVAMAVSRLLENRAPADR